MYDDYVIVRLHLQQQGFVHITGLDINRFSYEIFFSQFGHLQPQYDGQLIWSIKADARFDQHYHSLNTKELTPHTEYYELPGIPHRFQALWCVHPADCGGGQTTLADGYAFLNALSHEELEYLKSHVFDFVSSSGIQASNMGMRARHPMVEAADDGHVIFRFSCVCIQCGGDKKAEGIIQRCVEFFKKNHQAIEWKKGDILLWDNHRVLHSRTAFRDRQRELRRVFIN